MPAWRFYPSSVAICRKDLAAHIRLIGAALLLAACLAARAQEHHASTSAPGPAPASAPAPQPSSSAANEALRRSPEQMVSSNMVGSSSANISVADARLEMYRSRLDLALRLKEQKSYPAAQEKLEELVQSAAPPDLKQTALVELALLAQEQGQLGRAQQIYAQFIQRYPEHPDMPEILLRQGLLYRQMGAPTLALSKFYGVMNSALTIQEGDLPRHRRLVLQAQTEIAETYYLQGNYAQAADFLGRLLKLEEPDLNVAMVEYKLIRCEAMLGHREETLKRGREFLERHPEAAEVSEVRFEVALALKALKKNTEALAQLSELLDHQRALAKTDPVRWRYWQQRVGNEVANQLYQEGDYVHALELYETLSALDPSPAWQLPVFYQMGLAYERLEQPAKAIDLYQRITGRSAEIKDDSPASLRSVLDMARWRSDFLQWQAKTSRPLSLPQPNAALPAAAGNNGSPPSG